jgi:hypothetical protein
MSLYNLRREYEERRQALIQQLQKNPSLDAATQHQIYGAIKEIEHFIRTIDYQIGQEQDKALDVDLQRDRPSPFLERTTKAITHVAHGTKKVFTHHIPNAARKVASVPKNYFDRKKEEARLRKEIAAEMAARKQAHNAQLAQTSEHVMLEHPHQELAVKEGQHAENVPMHIDPAHPTAVHGAPLPTWNDETVVRTESQVIESHEKRAKPVSVAAKSKSHPSKKAKKGHQHKPHMKKDKSNRYHRKS